ncbi:hypothetical protein KW94_03860 [Clostridioides difficile]|nr:hypothetical protein KW94_03860 [Clostridioides difficile]
MRTTLNTLIEDVKQNYNNVLLNHNGNTLTNEELDKMSNQFGNFLLMHNIKKGDRIGLLLDLTIDSVISIFGILKIGAIYVPINPNQSVNNIKFIIEDTECKILISEEEYLNSLSSYRNKIIVHNMSNQATTDKIDFMEYKISSTNKIKMKIIDKDIIYIMYTSGTTGTPKGVMINHQCIMTFMNYVVNTFRHSKNTRSLCRTPIYFDPFLTEIIPSIMSGGQVYIQSKNVSITKLLMFIEKNKITNLGCGPSLLYLLVDNRHILKKYDMSSLEEIYIGYEKCNIKLIKSLQKILPKVDFINGYGTTETFAASTFYVIPNLLENSMTDIPIGKPIDDVDLFVINDNYEKVEFNEVGEIVLRGKTLFNGYWNNMEETTKHLKKNPLFKESNEFVYYTSDLAKIDSDGNIFFVGRKDDQIKIRGFRVELGEIKHVLENSYFIKECCILKINNNLVCFYSSYIDIEKSSIINFCKERLEDYKIPNKWFILDELPRNSNGKIDKKELESHYNKNISKIYN